MPHAAARWRLAAEWSLATRAWIEGRDPKARLPSPPTEEMLHIATAAVVARREASGIVAMRHELDGENLEEKRRQWRHLWARVEGLVVWFEVKYKDASTEDDAWCQCVAAHMRRLTDRLYRSLARRHPGMPRVDDLEGAEIVDVLIGLDEDDDLDELELEGENPGGVEQPS